MELKNKTIIEICIEQKSKEKKSSKCNKCKCRTEENKSKFKGEQEKPRIYYKGDQKQKYN